MMQGPVLLDSITLEHVLFWVVCLGVLLFTTFIEIRNLVSRLSK